MVPNQPKPLTQSRHLNRHFAPLPQLRDLGDPQMRMIRAFRVAAVLGKAGQCPMAAISPLVGGVAAAAQFLRVVQSIGIHWPEPFRLYRPCCDRVSSDEILLLDMITAMVGRDGPAFRGLLSDLLNSAAIGALQSEIAAFVAAHIAPRHGI